jgi:drug/metabolite transporter (DMT)-like permease
MTRRGLNRIAKALAGVGGVLLFFAIAGFSSESLCDEYRTTDGGGCRGLYGSSNNLLFAIVCLFGAAAAIGGAVAIRRKLGGPLISPWQRW